MYRQGLGDCFLISIPREGEAPYRAVIDCGVILGTPDASRIIREVVEDIIQTTGGRIDLLAATHEHWDHVSGFAQARELWTDTSRLQIGEVWMAWTEDADDPLGKKLRGERNALRVALAAASTRLRMSGDRRGADEVGNLLGFFGAAGDNTTSAALEVVRKLAGTPRYRHPQEPPFNIPGTDVKVYVLGPPHDEKFIKKYNPSTKQPETYGLAATEAFLRVVAPTPDDNETGSPFDEAVEIPLAAAQQSPFFQRHYWGEADGDVGPTDVAAADQSWRRIDGSWLDASSPLALQLDSATNNTSLVLAFELPSGEVFLFAADAQVGNWMSWQELSWTVDGRTVTGPDLLRRTVFYKVGHHGSHNATLREHGLEEMQKSLDVAFVPVDRAMAVKKRWGRMPLGEIIERLNEITKGKVVQSDEPVPKPLVDRVRADGLYYEISF
ncbi:MAG TPA: MBL fold metallo-hydrolase [Pyrinomonadaceae bacterium]|nr:MBL fold metallo-hydrolase [Pyrinomonadaceae bacterium]